MTELTVLDPGSPEEASQLAMAKEVGDVLCRHYPNHPWIVSFQGGGIVVRHIAIAEMVRLSLGKEGFSSLLPKNKMGTHREVAHSAVMFGGELLEAFGLRRGPWDGSLPVVPKNWKRKQTNNFS